MGTDMTRSHEKTTLRREMTHASQTAAAKRVNWLVSRAPAGSVLVLGPDGLLVTALLKVGASVQVAVRNEDDVEATRAATARLSSAVRDRLTIEVSDRDLIDNRFSCVVIPSVSKAQSIAELVSRAAKAAETDGKVLIALSIGVDEDGLTMLTEASLSPSIGSLPLGHLESTVVETHGVPIIHWLSAWTITEPTTDYAKYLQSASLVASESFAGVAVTWQGARSRLDQQIAGLEEDLVRTRAELAEARTELTQTRKEFTKSQEESARIQEESARMFDEERIGWRYATKIRVAELIGNDGTTRAVDPGVVCPVGYRRVVGGRVGIVGSLVSGREGVGDMVRLVEGLAGDPGVDVFGLVRGVSLPSGVRVFGGGFDTGLVERLRPYGGVVDHPGLHGSVAERAEVLVGLAAAGVPVAAADVDDELRKVIGDEMADVLASAEVADLGDPEARDRLSVLLRRLGLSTGSQVSKWREIAGSLGLTVAPLPTVSVVLATNRPEFLEHAIGSVKSQTYPEVELVLVLHGERFTRTDTELEELHGNPLVVVRVPSDVVYGDVLNRGVAASTGSLIAKMDDDDWYSPQHLWDLVRAMDYSGADLVGKAAEFVYLEELDITIRRMVEGSETYGNRNLASGTFLIKRTTLNTIGGWRRIRRTEDRGLIEDVVTAGGTIYRTFGHGYLLNRHGEGHEWEVDDGYFQGQAQATVEGRADEWALI